MSGFRNARWIVAWAVLAVAGTVLSVGNGAQLLASILFAGVAALAITAFSRGCVHWAREERRSS